jgi:hypothetical protein
MTIAPGLARAEYVCEVEMLGATQSDYGDYGMVRFTTTPNPGCSGTPSSFWFCSKKANGTFPAYTGCAVSLFSRHSVESLPILFSELSRAAHEAQRVKVGKGACQNSTAQTCVIAVTFQGF